MTSDTFTSELAQFAGVEQQIQTNTNLTQLLSLNQVSEVSQGTSLVGRQAVASSSQLPLQNGSAKLQISPTSAETVGIAITNPAAASSGRRRCRFRLERRVGPGTDRTIPATPCRTAATAPRW